MAVSPGAIIPEALPEFRIYIRSSEGKYILWALEGSKVSADQLAKLTEGGLSEVFVDLKDQFKYEQYLETNLGSILENQWASNDQKASIFSSVSANVVKNAFETSLGLGIMGADVIAADGKDGQELTDLHFGIKLASGPGENDRS